MVWDTPRRIAIFLEPKNHYFRPVFEQNHRQMSLQAVSPDMTLRKKSHRKSQKVTENYRKSDPSHRESRNDAGIHRKSHGYGFDTRFLCFLVYRRPISTLDIFHTLKYDLIDFSSSDTNFFCFLDFFRSPLLRQTGLYYFDRKPTSCGG